MKKMLVVMMSLCLVFVCVNLAFASSIGSTMPDTKKEEMSVRVGVEDNFIFQRDIEGEGSMTGGETGESNEAYVTVAVQPVNYMTVYGKVGMADLEETFEWNIGRSQKIEFDYGILVGGGVNLLYDFDNGFGIGWDSQVVYSHNDADSVSGDHSPSLTSEGSVDNLRTQSTIYGKYDLDLGKNGVLTPYIGGGYLLNKSYIDKDIQVTDDVYIYTYGDAENGDKFGPVAGLSYKLGENFLLNVEGRFIAETSVTGGLSYKF